tara:strand:- start:287 stop:1189 length:903 start_codon:yes stop_codon:yes gene_type:complete
MRALNYKNDNFNITEPFKSLFTQGMVCHETYKDGNNNWLSPDQVERIGDKYFVKEKKDEVVKVGPSESMSKSKKNVIDPELIIQNYGADSVRLFILSDSPPEKDVQWSEQGMVSSYKFIQKLWILNTEIKRKIKKEGRDILDDKIEKFTNQTISKITNNLEKFNYNVIIANMYESYNFLINYIKINKNIKNLESNYKKILTCFFPVIPHFTSECLNDLGALENLSWPEYQKDLLDEDKVNIVVQINGKKRALLNVKKNIRETDLLEFIKKDNITEKYINNTKINKVIYVQNRLINILIND